MFAVLPLIGLLLMVPSAHAANAAMALLSAVMLRYFYVRDQWRDQVRANAKASLQALSGDGVALHFVLEAYKHLKPLGTDSDAKAVLDKLGLQADEGMVVGSDQKAYKALIAAIAKHRVWSREAAAKAIPA